MSNTSGFKRISDSICVSTCTGLTLSEYVSSLSTYCSLVHDSSCTTCKALITVAQMVVDNGFVLLAQAFRSAFPRLTYHSHCAKQHVSKMPLAALRVGTPESGVAEVYLFELIKGVDYHQFLNLLNSFTLKCPARTKCWP